jgi:hypothetical protein
LKTQNSKRQGKFKRKLPVQNKNAPKGSRPWGEPKEKKGTGRSLSDDDDDDDDDVTDV